MKQIKEKDLIVSLRSKSKKSDPKESFQKSLLNKIQKDTKKKQNLFTLFFSKKYIFIPTLILLLIIFTIPALEFRNLNDSNIGELSGAILENSNLNAGNEDKSITNSPDYNSDKLSYENSKGTPNNYNIQQQPLSGREVDDNVDYDNYIKYKQNSGFYYLYNLDKTRYKIIVLDKNNNPVFNQKITVKANASTSPDILTTYANGSVYYFPNARYKAKPSEYNPESSTFNIYIGNQQFIRSSQEREWTFKLDHTVYNQNPDLEVAFILDTTGSMQDQIDQLKLTIKSISNQADQLQNIRNVKWGLVLYRDKGDEYVYKKFDFTNDINQFQSILNQVQAAGGGDYPEDTNTALNQSVENLSWSDNSIKLNFLITDAPPHQDYGQNYNYADAAISANSRGMKIFTLASSGLDNSEGEYIYRQLALISNAKYLFITNSNGDTNYHIDDQNNQFTVKKLDKLIVDLISNEANELRN